MTTPVLYVNGRLAPVDALSLSPLDRGFSIADGVFETMAARGSRVFRLPDHLARLRAGAETLAIPLPSWDDFPSIIRATLERNALADATVRLTVTRGVDQGRGLAIPAEASPTVVVRVTPRQTPAGDQPGLHVVVSSIRRDEASPLSRMKSLAYTSNVLARLEAQRARADDALLPNIAGCLVCATSSNLFLVLDGVLVTPPIQDGALPGIGRATVLEIAGKAGVATREESVGVQDARHASEVFLTNVVTGPRAVVAVGGEAIGDGNPGPIASRVTAAYWKAVADEIGLGTG